MIPFQRLYYGLHTVEYQSFEKHNKDDRLYHFIDMRTCCKKLTPFRAEGSQTVTSKMLLYFSETQNS